MEYMVSAASFVTPLMILILGFFFNKKLETLKAVTGWKKTWSDDFLKCSTDFSERVSQVVVNLSMLVETQDIKDEGWEDKRRDVYQQLPKWITDISLLDWEIQKYIQYIPSSGNQLIESQKNLNNLLSNVLSNGHGDLEEIREAQFIFNKSVRKAHLELLGLIDAE